MNVRCLLLVLVATCCSWGQRGLDSPAGYGAFALPDESGTRLIAIPGMPGAADARAALCSDGSNVPVKYEGQQPEKAGNGRQTPAQFQNLGGDVFRIQGSVNPTAACFLLGGGWISAAEPVPLRREANPQACGTGIAAKMAALKKRAVVQCFSLAQFGNDGRIVLAEFASTAKAALASIVVMDGNRTLFADYPAEYRGPGKDIWRVDDGGKLSPRDFSLVFLVRRGAQRALGVSWSGTEGRSLAVFATETGGSFKRVIEGYWYHMAE